ncbi:MAG TPA: DUF5939 domain-containing protein [Pyrinomonadaceae bacterium]
MSYKEFHYRWEYELESSPEALWPLVADTNRFNRDTDVPALLDDDSAVAGEPAPKGGLPLRRLRISKLGINVAWDEEPFEWIRPHRFGVVRRYVRGPVEEMRVAAELSPRETGGTRLVYEVWARPRTALGLVAIPAQIGRISARRFASVIRRYDRRLRDRREPFELSTRPQISATGRARLTSMSESLVKQGASAELVSRLSETIERADDLTLARLRPYALADYWHAPRRAVLELCLYATRAGLLDFRWDVLCPLCRGAQHTAKTLREMQSDAHCDTCQIDFKANFDRFVEVTFRPNAAVREVAAREFCIGGPQVTPHVFAQQILPPGTPRTLALALEEGRYRLRASGLSGSRPVTVAEGGDASAALTLDTSGWPEEELLLAPRVTLWLENETGSEQLLILERTAWSDQAATAADVTSLQLFRDLFAREALRPGDQISVGSLTVLFTDLKGSTRLYREIGDAVAFGAVMNHFDVLRETIAEEGGAIIKTIGDAVMAVFRQPASALRAAVRAQRTLASPSEGMLPLRLKAGIHTGACIAVTLNERLDYFGSNINIAARLEPLSDGTDIVISSAVRDDPQVASMLDEETGDLALEPLETALKGFEAERFALWRVRKRVEGKEKGKEKEKEESER